MGKTKLLMGITLSEMGGAQKVVYDIISSLPAHRYDITLTAGSGDDLFRWVRDLKAYKGIEVRVIEIPELKREISPIYDIRAFLKLYRMLRDGDYEIAHFHSSKIGILGRLAAYLAGVPKILFTVHGWGINEYQPLWLQWILGLTERLAERCCTMCLCVSKYHMDIGLERGWLRPNRARVIYNGIDPPPNALGKLRQELKIEENEAILGTVIRLRKPKEPLFTIRAFKEILDRHHRAKLIIIGDGPMHKDCLDLIDTLDLRDKVYMLGTREDTRELLNDMDVITMFSRWEGLPISIIEAMIAGKPVVASRVGGIPELIDNEVDGLLLEGFGTHEAADLIGGLIANRSIAENIGERAREKAQKGFSKVRMVEEYDRIYRGL